MKLTICLFAAFVIFSMKESSMTDILKENEIYYILLLLLKILPVSGDGNCLFRAVSCLLFHNENQHDSVQEIK